MWSMFESPFFKVIFLMCCICNQAENTTIGLCNVTIHTGFQLQFAGPIDDNYLHKIEVGSVAECSNKCCNDTSCDAALLADKVCIMATCLPTLIEESPCRSYEAGEDVISYAKGLNTTLLYINHRGGNQSGLISSIFNATVKTVGGAAVTTTAESLVFNNSVAMEWTGLAENLTDVILYPSNYGNITEPFHGNVNVSIAYEHAGSNMTTVPPYVTFPFASSPNSSVMIDELTPTAVIVNVTNLDEGSATESSAFVTDAITNDTKASTVMTTTTVGERVILVNISGTKQVRLPADSVVLQVHADGVPEQSSGFSYLWELIDHPLDFQGEQAIQEDTLTLSNLTAGSYQFKATIMDTNAHGVGYVNVTVLEPFRINKPPVAVISPVTQVISLPTDNTVLDGSSSYDDEEISSYHWERQTSPLQATEEKMKFEDDRQFLQLNNLVEGYYEFELTVTDSDGVIDSTTANFTVKKKIDNKPIAYAGGNQLIQLPQDSVQLCGNGSTDDWGIVGYKWSIAADSEKQVVDMQGTRTVCVQLSHLEVGDYSFQLTITDGSGQEDTSVVTVKVLPESNHPPVADAGDQQQFFLPSDGGSAVVHLDGSKSTDDKQLKSVHWKQTSGPVESTITFPNSLTTKVSGLSAVGKYVFTLTITDAEGESNNADVAVIVNEERAPSANAGPDVSVFPNDMLLLDGSNSKDDYGIQTYLWTRDSASPAVGRILNNSDHQSVLRVIGLTEGTYRFHLTVTNIRRKTNTDTVQVTVLPDPLLNNLCELHITASPNNFDEKDKVLVMKQISLLLSLGDDDHLVSRSIYQEHHSDDLVLLFYVLLSNGKIMDASEVVHVLTTKLQSKTSIIDVNIKQVDTYVCRNNCSGHGQCRSRKCVCDIFWTENFFRVYIGDGVRNCDWSLLYVVIVIVFVALSIGSLTYLITWKIARRNKTKIMKRKRRSHVSSRNRGYKLLSSKMNASENLKKNGLTKHSASYRPEPISRGFSTSSSYEDDTLFEKHHLIDPTSKTKVKSTEDRIPLVEFEGYCDSSDDGFDGAGLDKGMSFKKKEIDDETI